MVFVVAYTNATKKLSYIVRHSIYRDHVIFINLNRPAFTRSSIEFHDRGVLSYILC